VVKSLKRRPYKGFSLKALPQPNSVFYLQQVVYIYAYIHIG